MNVKLENVAQAFDCVQPTGSTLTIDRTGHVFPAGGHLQGVQRVSGNPDRIFLTSSSDREAYMVACPMQPAGSKNGGYSFEKAAGLQIISTTRFEVYAAKGTSGDHATGTTITLNRFRAD